MNPSLLLIKIQAPPHSKQKILVSLRVWSFGMHAMFISPSDELGDFCRVCGEFSNRRLT